MNLVQPIRDPAVLEGIKEYLKQTNERNYILFLIGINTGLRISDILPLRVEMVKGSHISLRERKTGKQKQIKINPTLRHELTAYLYGKDDNEFIFKSRSKKKKSGLKNRSIDRTMAYKMLNKVAREFGLKEIGTHTMRKTFGYHFYLKTMDVALLMDLFNHSDQSVTLRYIGVNQDTIDAAMNKFGL